MHPAVSNGSYDVERDPRGFPDPVDAGLRQAAGLSRQRRLGAEAEGRARPAARRPTPPNTPTCIAACTISPTPRPKATRARARRCARSSTRSGRKRSSSPATPPRRSTSSPTRSARERIQPGDEIVLSIMEHHSNIVPWHFLRERQGAVIKWAPVDEDGNFLLDEFEKLLTPRTKMVAMTQMSNALGTIVPIKEVVRLAHARGIPVLVDGSQARGASRCRRAGHRLRLLRLHRPQAVRPDRHRRALRQVRASRRDAAVQRRRRDDPEVFEDRVTYGEPPHKFEAGTPPIVQAIGLGAAIDYIQSIGKARIRAHETDVVNYAHERLRRDQFAAHHRHRQGKGRDRLVRDEGRASARCRDHHRPRGRRGARRHALRHAAARALRRDRDLPGVVRALQYQGGSRQPGAGA